MKSPWAMDDQESETVFDHLVSVTVIYATDSSLTRVPSLKNMGALQELQLSGNQITMIRPNDFAGATRLLQLMLDNNECVNSFEQGNLKHRELDGREVSSQPDDSETDDDDHEEDDDYEELS